MKLLLQGMRRSGTTIVSDAIAQEEGISFWYEPLAEGIKPSIGGGSGARAEDLFVPVRAARRDFLAARGLEDGSELNFGAPRDPALELRPDFSPLVSDYLRFLLDRPGPVAAKFTRIYAKVPAAARIAPGAAFVHLVRDPRAVARSYLFGKDARNAAGLRDADRFFGRKSGYSAWSSHALSQLLLEEYRTEDLPDPTDCERVLLVWRFTFERVRRDLGSAFLGRDVLVRHEDYCADPRRQLGRIYALVERDVPGAVASWAEANTRRPAGTDSVDEPHWRRAFERMNMLEAVASAGYA